MRKTKIICTLGPSTDDEAVLRALMQNGMNVARFNFSHQTHPEHKKRFDTLVRLREELNLPVAALLDTKGPEIRLGDFENGKIELHEGDAFTLTTEKILGNEKRASVTFAGLPADVSVGTRILIDDGLIEMKATAVRETEIDCIVTNGGPVSNHKGVNVPGVTLSMPFISEQDERDICFGIETGFDFIAASFTRSADDIRAIRRILTREHCDWMKIIAKIENADGVNNIDEILRVADGIMVARGDMGVEIPMEDVPILQKKLILKAYNAGKLVITATQMLDSMMKNPRPTRAESTDVANAIYDGTSAIMLSGETAAGKYPVESLITMAQIATRTEADIDYRKRFANREMTEAPHVTNAISHATVSAAHDLGASAIITVTKSGDTARMISKYRPSTPIIGCTFVPRVLRQMNLSWGVIPVEVEEKRDTDELFDHAVECALRDGAVHTSDLVVITAGIPLGVSGTTNMLKVHVVGDILIKGAGVTDGTVHATLCVAHDEEAALRQFQSGDILVVPQVTKKMLDLVRYASGIITEAGGSETMAEIVGRAMEIPVIIGAEHATDLLKNGISVLLDAKNGIVSNEDSGA